MPNADGQENFNITLDEASVLTRNYREHEGADARLGGFFSKDAVQNILRQKECTGIRYYYALDADANKVLVIVGVRADNNDMIDGPMIEMSVPCPTLCSNPNPLNS